VLLLGLPVTATGEGLPRLQVSQNGRSLVTEPGKPFFWLGDTAWSIIDQSIRESTENEPSVERYFRIRRRQGFNVVQTHLLTNLVRGPIEAPNAYGHEPFVDGDFTKPRIVPGPANDYWDHADHVIALAAEHGMYVAVVAAWSNSLLTDDHPMVQETEAAYAYGHFLGDRYRRETHIIWLLGGDAFGRPASAPLSPARRRMTRALAEGITDGVCGIRTFDGTADWQATLMSYHPPGGGRSSSEFLHDEPWLDFNMIQSSARFGFKNHETVSVDFSKLPHKPTLDGEVAYEYSLTLNRRERELRPGDRLTPWDVRRAAYWSVFSGACGFTYGHRNLIGWVRRGEPPLKWGADRPWFESLESPGAQQMILLRHLIQSRPMFRRVPDQSLVIPPRGEGFDHVRATRAANGRCAMVYLPTGAPVTVDLEKLTGDTLEAHWYDPKTGRFTLIDRFARDGRRRFIPETQGQGRDWVLVLTSVKR
jgi:hypothetical protein